VFPLWKFNNMPHVVSRNGVRDEFVFTRRTNTKSKTKEVANVTCTNDVNYSSGIKATA
jgi:hypothetical protein